MSRPLRANVACNGQLRMAFCISNEGNARWLWLLFQHLSTAHGWEISPSDLPAYPSCLDVLRAWASCSQPDAESASMGPTLNLIARHLRQWNQSCLKSINSLSASILGTCALCVKDGLARFSSFRRGDTGDDLALLADLEAY